MHVRKTPEGWDIGFTDDDLVKWKNFLAVFASRAQMERPLGWWRMASNADLWTSFVEEFLVRGGTRLIDRMKDDEKRWEQFLEKTSLKSLCASKSPLRELQDACEGTTRFWKKAAKEICECLRNEQVISNREFVLLVDLPQGKSEIDLRAVVYGRCPSLGPKGVSNFLIKIGAAQDLAAIDTRILGVLKKHFNAGPEVDRAKSWPKGYMSLESSLRDIAKRNGVHLALLDRAVFQATGQTALDFVIDSAAAQTA